MLHRNIKISKEKNINANVFPTSRTVGKLHLLPKKYHVRLFTLISLSCRELQKKKAICVKFKVKFVRMVQIAYMFQ